MKIDSPYWDWELGVCEKHYLPSVPCPACLAEDGDSDVEFIVSKADEDFITFENMMDSEKKLTLQDLIPSNFKDPQFR